MPVSIKQTDGKYRVSTPGGVKSKGSTLRNAMSQKRLLYAVEHGWKSTGKKSTLKRVAIERRGKKI